MVKKPAATAAPDDEDLLLPDEAAAYLRVPVATLEAWRRRRRVDGSKQGPRFIRIEGRRVRYPRKYLRQYVQQQERAAAAEGTPNA